MSQLALEKLKQKFEVLHSHDYRGDETAVVKREEIVEICSWLKETSALQFNMLTDMTAVDYLPREPRFEVVYLLYSMTRKHRLRLKVQVPEEDPVVDTLCEQYKIANWLEREIWDMYGIRFTGHPEMRRILLYEEFVGHPLRKDYPVDKRQPLVRRPASEIAKVMAKRRAAR